jgi:hypothetical protein
MSYDEYLDDCQAKVDREEMVPASKLSDAHEKIEELWDNIRRRNEIVSWTHGVLDALSVPHSTERHDVPEELILFRLLNLVLPNAKVCDQTTIEKVLDMDLTLTTKGKGDD